MPTYIYTYQHTYIKIPTYIYVYIYVCRYIRQLHIFLCTYTTLYLYYVLRLYYTFKLTLHCPSFFACLCLLLLPFVFSQGTALPTNYARLKPTRVKVFIGL